jgi:hypothetical protein
MLVMIDTIKLVSTSLQTHDVKQQLLTFSNTINYTVQTNMKICHKINGHILGWSLRTPYDYNITLYLNIDFKCFTGYSSTFNEYYYEILTCIIFMNNACKTYILVHWSWLSKEIKKIRIKLKFIKKLDDVKR